MLANDLVVNSQDISHSGHQIQDKMRNKTTSIFTFSDKAADSFFENHFASGPE